MRIPGLALLVVATLLVPRHAAAITAAIDEFAADFAGGSLPAFSFLEDFDDGVIAPELFPFCGALADEDESGGVLALRTPSFAPGCNGMQGVSYLYADTGSIAVRGTFEFRIPGLGESYGISVGGVSVLDFASLGVSQVDFGPAFGRQLVVFLLDEYFAVNGVELLVLPGLPEDLPFTAVSLELSATLVGGELLPHGRVSFDGGLFQDLGEVLVTDSPNAGALSAQGSHAASFFNVSVSEPATALLLGSGLAGLALTARRSARRDPEGTSHA